MGLDLTGVDLLTESVSTRRLLLRPWRRSDADDIVLCCNDPDIANWLPLLPSPYTLKDAHTFITDIAWDQQRAGTGLPLAMEEPGTGRLVGSIGIGGLTGVRGAEIGYWVAAFARGRGYAAEATDALAAWGVRPRGAPRATARGHRQCAEPARGRAGGLPPRGGSAGWAPGPAGRAAGHGGLRPAGH